jgi:hypothetical protein
MKSNKIKERYLDSIYVNILPFFNKSNFYIAFFNLFPNSIRLDIINLKASWKVNQCSQGNVYHRAQQACKLRHGKLKTRLFRLQIRYQSIEIMQQIGVQYSWQQSNSC